MNEQFDALEQIMAVRDQPVWELWTQGVSIQIAARPAYCNRGNFLATIDGPPSLNLDQHDGWPRYYFDLERAKLECEAWIAKRGLMAGIWKVL